MMIIRFYVIYLLNFGIYLTIVNSYDNVKIFNDDDNNMDMLNEIKHEKLPENFIKLHRVKRDYLSNPMLIDQESVFSTNMLLSPTTTSISQIMTVTESTTPPIYIITSFSTLVTTVQTTTLSYNPDSCYMKNFVQLFNGTCISKTDALTIAVSILNNRSYDATSIANALSLYISSITNLTIIRNQTNVLSVNAINKIIDNFDGVNLTVNSNTSFLMIQRPKKGDNMMVLGASVKRGMGGKIVDATNKENIMHSFLSAAAIVNQESLNGVISFNMLIIDKPTGYEYVDNSTNKILASSVIVTSLRRNNSNFTSIIISLYFNPLDEYKRNESGKYLCSFYDTKSFQWNESGCSDAQYNNEYNRYECVCNHLTSFALIWLPEALLIETGTQKLDAQDIASLIFQSISILCFLAIIIHAIRLRIIKSSIDIQALNLLPLISTASTTILFIFFIILSMVVYTQTSSSNQTQCFFSSSILMFIVYFLLIFMFCVKTSVGYFYYLRFVRLFPPPSHRKLLIMLIISFIISLLCVVLAIGFNSNSSYNITQLYPYKLCWFTRNVIYYFLTIPICIFLLLNIITMILVSKSIITYVRNATYVRNVPISGQINERLKRSVLVLLSSCVTQGVGWLFGPFISFISPTAGNILGWIFIIMNGFEGVWSIILYVLIRLQQMDKQRHISAAIELLKTIDVPSSFSQLIPILSLNETCWPTANNLTCVLNNVLFGYNKQLRPNHTGDPIHVQVYLMVITLGPIVELDMSFKMNLFFRQIWTDERLTLPNKISNVSVSTKLLSAIWKPDTYFMNSHSGFLHTTPTLNHLLRILEHGRLLYSSRLTITAYCSMLLHRFPLDVQTCSLILSSYAYGTRDVIYDWKLDEHNGVELERLKLSQFDLFNYKISKREIQLNDRNHSVLQLDLRMRRSVGYYLLQGYIPAALLVILSWISFWIDSEATADRVYIGITSILSLTTLALDIRSHIPAVPYLTAIDYFFIICYLFLLASLIQYTAVHRYLEYGHSLTNTRTSEDLCESARQQNISIATRSSNLYVLRSSRVPKVRSVSHARRATVGVVAQGLLFLRQKAPLHKLDRLARIGFPVLFVLCNCVYWYIFVFYTSE
ncbi:unnamed protein product [Rotaria sordida]|uniref:Gamma-aminobutyric acid receptor subunit beta n=1 Tax=Rotaria sordida TaxID=392033 RepID=A0A813WCQ5_9BILA|nr:unnamed protein product [Rotaria sordida]